MRNIEQKSDGHVGTGLVGAQWLMRTLTDNGHADLAYKIATQKTYPGWGYMVEQGATTIWELWNGNTADPAMNSGNHVMQIGDLAVWMYEYLAGIRTDPEKPGFRHAIIHPYPGRRPDLRQGDAQDDVRPARQFLEAGERTVHARGHGAAEHHRHGMGAGEGCGGSYRIRQEGRGREGREVRAHRKRRRHLRSPLRRLQLQEHDLGGAWGDAGVWAVDTA